MKIRNIAVLAALLAVVPSTAFAQTAPAPQKPSMMQKMKNMMHMPTGKKTPMASGKKTPMAGGKMAPMMASGKIIGDKKTHVFHMPGDKNLPMPQNRVYFSSAKAAEAAGYHMAGSGTGKTGMMAKKKAMAAKGMMGHEKHAPKPKGATGNP